MQLIYHSLLNKASSHGTHLSSKILWKIHHVSFASHILIADAHRQKNAMFAAIDSTNIVCNHGSQDAESRHVLIAALIGESDFII